MPQYAHIIITFSKIWEDFVEVTWSRELFDGATLKRYHLLATADDYKIERLFELNDDTTYRLVGLVPGSDVKVSMRAQFDGGEWGNWCSSTATLHPSCSVHVGAVGQDSIHGHFKWGSNKEPTATHNWCTASKFHLRVRQKENVLSAFVCDKELTAEQREFKVEDLNPQGVFNVQIRAVNQYGEVGKWSDVVRFLTLCNVVVKITEVGEDYAVAWWGREGEEVGTQPPSVGNRNSVQQFSLRLELFPSQSQLLSNPNAQPTVVNDQLFTGTVCVNKMENLLPGRVYGIHSRHLNIQGDWSPWTCSKFKTANKTSMIGVQAVSHNFLLISWDREQPEEADDTVALSTSAEVVNWQVRCVNVPTQEESTVILPKQEKSTRIINLPANTEFKLSARAKTAYGQWGPWGESAYVSTLSALQVNVDAVGEGWLKLNWARNDKRHHDSVVRYHVQVSAAATPFRLSKYFPADITEYRFEELASATEYRVSIQACIDDRWQPWSEAITVKTAGPASVHLVRRGEDFIQLRWSSEFYELNGVDPLDQKYQLKVVRLSTSLGTEESIMCQEFTNVFGYRITKLDPSSRVSVQIRAYNAPQDKWGSWCPPETIVTLPSVISFTMIGETCFEVAWQRKPRTVSAVYDTVPVDEDPLAPSEAVMYILRVNVLSEDGVAVPLEKYHFTDEDKPFFIVEGLKPNHSYSAQLCTADAQQTWSPWSAAAVVTTMPPLKLEVQELGEDYCKITWQREKGAEDEWDEADTKYRIAATSLTLDENGGAAAQAQLKYFVDGDQNYTLRHLAPDTSYRMCISAYPKRTNVWGVWSEAVYVRTNSSIEVELDAVGEDYAHVSWKRIPPSDELAKLHPCCEPIYVGTVTQENPTAAKLNEIKNQKIEENLSSGEMKALKPSPVYIADASITEFNVKVFSVKEGEEGGEAKRELEFESFLAYDSSTIRIPHLNPNTSYEVGVCACNPKGEWGVVSNLLPYKTTMPTEMVVSEITHSYVRVKWGRGVSETNIEETKVEQIEKCLVKIVGTDDDFCKEVTLPGSQTEYDIQSLSINCCYSVSVKSMHEGSWGHWSNPIYVALKSIDVRLVETSQDWLKLNWFNKAIPDGRQRQLFITLIGDGRATTRTLPSGSDTEYVFTDLLPLTVYSVHLLCVEQVPAYAKNGGWNRPSDTRDYAPTIPESGRPTDTSITVALPLIAADYSSFYTDSCAFSTLANIALEVVSVGENFVTTKWCREVHAHAAEVLREKSAEYEISCCSVTDSGTSASKKIKGAEITISNLSFNTLYELRVRKVSMLTSAWSKAVTVQTLDKVRVQVGPPGISLDDIDTQVGVGEDFILLNWERGAGKISPQTSFCVKCSCEQEGADKEEEFTTTETHYRLTNLQSDMRYKIQVRSIIDNEGQLRMGEWSDEIVLCTLSPMNIKVVMITEETAEVKWTRRGEGSQATHTIGSYHLKIYSLPKAKNGEAEEPKVLEERQLLESDPEFQTCCIKLIGLKPSHSYTAMVRASTENSWGAWSDGVTFTTQPLLCLEINLVGEECVFLSWGRENKSKRKSLREVQTPGSVEMAVVETCELSVSTVGKDRTHFCKKLPASPNHYRLDSLTPNMQYSFCLRPCYSNGAYGIWCEQLYCCTLAPTTVEVSRIGETFVHVQWQRAPQQRIAARLREQQQQQQLEFEDQQRNLQNEIEVMKQELDDGGVYEREFLAMQSDATDNQPVALEGSTKLEQMLKTQRQQQLKQQQLAKLQELQLLELERVTKYPDGDDMRYEVVITGTADNVCN